MQKEKFVLARASQEDAIQVLPRLVSEQEFVSACQLNCMHHVSHHRRLVCSRSDKGKLSFFDQGWLGWKLPEFFLSFLHSPNSLAIKAFFVFQVGRHPVFSTGLLMFSKCYFHRSMQLREWGRGLWASARPALPKSRWPCMHYVWASFKWRSAVASLPEARISKRGLLIPAQSKTNLKKADVCSLSLSHH